jgi:hypothetical protein
MATSSSSANLPATSDPMRSGAVTTASSFSFTARTRHKFPTKLYHHFATPSSIFGRIPFLSRCEMMMLRLFLSVDVTGSTLFKAKAQSQAAVIWLETFEALFTKFPLMLTGELAVEFADESTLPRIDVWKVMGDEILFNAVPERAEHLVLLVRGLYSTMRRYEDIFFANQPLRLKASSWVATFPSPNIEIKIPELSSVGQEHVDYIGPDIDLGFRISKFARPSSVTLSIDLVDLLLRANNHHLLEFYLLGREPLKGVLFGRPYPIIWTRPTEQRFFFEPWEIDECSITKAASCADPTPHDTLVQEVAGIRRYLRKMQGIDRDSIGF